MPDANSEALDEPKREPCPGNLYTAIRSIVEPLGGVDLDILAREPIRDSPRFE